MFGLISLLIAYGDIWFFFFSLPFQIFWSSLVLFLMSIFFSIDLQIGKKLFKTSEILKMHFLTQFPPLPPFSLFLPSASFYNLPCVADFIIDILLGSPSAEVRVPLYKAPLALFCLGPWVPVAVCGLQMEWCQPPWGVIARAAGHQDSDRLDSHLPSLPVVFTGS